MADESLSASVETSQESIVASISELQTIKSVESSQPSILEDIPDIPTSASDFTIPQVDVTSAPSQSSTQLSEIVDKSEPSQHHLAQPVAVTASLSTDSAYSQVSDTLSSGAQETSTGATTPDLETSPMPKVDEVDESENVNIKTSEFTVETETSVPAEAATSEKSLSPGAKTPTGIFDNGVSSLGVTHTLAMTSFPSAFGIESVPETGLANKYVFFRGFYVAFTYYLPCIGRQS